MCVTSLLCGQWADLWPFYGLGCKRFSLCIKVAVYSTTHKTAKRQSASAAEGEEGGETCLPVVE